MLYHIHKKLLIVFKQVNKSLLSRLKMPLKKNNEQSLMEKNSTLPSPLLSFCSYLLFFLQENLSFCYNKLYR